MKNSSITLVLTICLAFLLVGCTLLSTASRNERQTVLPERPSERAIVHLSPTVPTNSRHISAPNTTNTAKSGDDWQRYTDSELEISFEYPTTWQLQPFEPEAEGDAYALELYRQWVGTINIQRQENPEHLTPQEWFERQRGSRYDPALVSELAEITVQGNSGIVLGQPDTCRTVPMIVAIITHDDYLFVISQYERGTRTTALEMKLLLESLSFGAVTSASTSLPSSSMTYPPAPTDIACP